MNISRKKKKGFTLIELMAVIAIIAILAVIMIPNVSGYITRAKKTLVITQVRNTINAIETYHATSAEVQINETEKVSELVNENGVLKKQELLEERDVDKISKLNVKMIRDINKDKDAVNNIIINNKGEITQYKETEIKTKENG